jgi:hypothetical protein
LESTLDLQIRYGASDRSQLAKRPNNLLFAEAIRDDVGCKRWISDELTSTMLGFAHPS